MKIPMYDARKAAFILYQQYREAREKNQPNADELFNKLMGLLRHAGYPNDFFHGDRTPEQVFDFFNRYEGKTNTDFIGHVTEFFKTADQFDVVDVGSGWVLPKF